jgi:hypothetical protein
MKRKQLRYGKGFTITLGNDRSQGLKWWSSPEGRKEGLATGIEARINGSMSCQAKVPRNQAPRDYPSGPARYCSLSVDTGTRFEIVAGTALKTLNFYPPAYTKSGDESPHAKP